MFPSPREILRHREGSLASTPFALLLNAIFVEQRTVALELKKNQLEKRLAFEDGWPVACRSNLLHETLGRFLVERQRISEAQCHEALAESAREEKPLGEILVRRGLLQPFDLYKAMQQSMARKILDCFTWTDADWRLHGSPGEEETPLRMNPAQLVLTASTTVMPFEVVTNGLQFAEGQRFALSPSPPHDPKQLRLHTRDRRLLELLRRRPSFDELLAAGLSGEEARRRLYAFGVLGILARAEEVPVSVLVPAPAPVVPELPETTTQPPGPDASKLANEVMELFLKHRSMDAFELLGVDPSVSMAELRRAWLSFAERFLPARFNGELAGIADKAEELFLAGTKAWATLSDYESRNLAVERRRKRQEETKRRRGEAGADFRIQTKLLDAGEQFRDGVRLVEAGQFGAAIEHLEFACDCDPGKASYRAHLGWARYRLNPMAPERGLRELLEALRSDPACHEAYWFQGQIQREQGDHAAAEESFRRAVKAKPDERRYTEAMMQAGRARKRAQAS